MDNERVYGLGNVTDAQAEARHKAAEREFPLMAAATKHREKTVKKWLDAMSRRAGEQWGYFSPGEASAKRVAAEVLNICTSMVSGKMLSETEKALDEVPEVEFRVDAWVANFYQSRGKLPPFTFIRGGEYKEPPRHNARFPKKPKDDDPNALPNVEA